MNSKKKPFYFNDAPELSSDPAKIQQYLKVCEFRQELQTLGIVGSYRGVRGTDEAFHDQVLVHLQNLTDRFLAKLGEADVFVDQGAVSGAADLEIAANYLECLQRDCEDVDLLGMRLKHGQIVRLNAVYVPLITPVQDRQTQDRESLQRRRRTMALEGDAEAKRTHQLLLNWLEKESLYVSGPPGGGKSTFCRWAAWLAANGSLPAHEIAGPEGYQEEFPQSFRGRLPLLVRLREFWKFLPLADGRQTLTVDELETALGAWADAQKLDGLTAQQVRAQLVRGSLLLILDGVDEVPISHGPSAEVAQPRAMLLTGLAAATPQWTRRGHRLLLTSRPYGVGEAEGKKLGISHAPISDLDDSLQEMLLQRWFRCLIQHAEDAHTMAAEMLSHIRERAGIQELAGNPLLLTAMCIIFQEGKRLPEDKFELYDRIIDTVLYNRFPHDRTKIDPVRARMCAVAYAMHTGETLGEQRSTPQAIAKSDEIDRGIQAYQDSNVWTDASYTSAVEAREELLTRSGLLLPTGERTATFYHFSLQEFMAAQRFLDVHRQDDQLLAAVCDGGRFSEWRNTLSFVFASLLGRSTTPERAIVLLSELTKRLEPDDLNLGIVAGDALQILTKRGFHLQPALEQKFRQHCLSAIDREVELNARFDLALALGYVGDRRVVNDLRDPAAYVPIPAGSYVFGEQNKGQKIKQPFRMTRFPVTNSQYQLFIEDKGYEDAQWWSPEGWQWRSDKGVVEPMYWRNAKWNAPNQPVVGVSYWEAEACAKWAGGRLPTEQQWEAAARGPDGHEYPWGKPWEDGICNSVEAGLNRTSPVGLFPRSRSCDFELEDMAGNVWEWCEDFYDPATPNSRVLRGGSWGYYVVYCRSAYRLRFVPSYRLVYGGFRVLLFRQDS